MLDNRRPTFDRLLIEKIEPQEVKSESGIIISTPKKHAVDHLSGAQLVDKEQEEQDNTFNAKVVRIGSQVTIVKEGDIIITTKYAGVKLTNNDSIILINEKDILAIVE